MLGVFRIKCSHILVIGVALNLLCSSCQSPSPQSEAPTERTFSSTPTTRKPDIPDIPVKPIAEIAKELDRDAGFVLAGAYVLDLEPNRVVEGRRTYGTVGYLSVGQIVFLDGCDTQITAYRPSMNPLMSSVRSEAIETYCRVTTSSGIEGLVRVDRVARLKNRVAIATGDVEISVFAESPDPLPSQSIGRFSRTEGTYVEILEESTKYFRVRMPWSDPEDTEGFLMRTSETSSSYAVVDETLRVAVPVSFRPAVTNAIERIEEISGLPLKEIVRLLSTHNSQDIKVADLSSLLCGLDAKAFAELGFSALGSGAGISAQFRLSEPGISHSYALEVMQVGDTDLRTFAMVERLRCRGAQPDRMDSFGIAGKPSKTTENEFWFTRSAQDDPPVRQIGRQAMFTIAGNDAYYDFERIRGYLVAAAEDNAWLDSVGPWERQIILDHILTKVAFVSANAR